MKVGIGKCLEVNLPEYFARNFYVTCTECGRVCLSGTCLKIHQERRIQKDVIHYTLDGISTSSESGNEYISVGRLKHQMKVRQNITIKPTASEVSRRRKEYKSLSGENVKDTYVLPIFDNISSDGILS